MGAWAFAHVTPYAMLSQILRFDCLSVKVPPKNEEEQQDLEEFTQELLTVYPYFVSEGFSAILLSFGVYSYSLDPKNSYFLSLYSSVSPTLADVLFYCKAV